MNELRKVIAEARDVGIRLDAVGNANATETMRAALKSYYRGRPKMPYEKFDRFDGDQIVASWDALCDALRAEGRRMDAAARAAADVTVATYRADGKLIEGSNAAVHAAMEGARKRGYEGWRIEDRAQAAREDMVSTARRRAFAITDDDVRRVDFDKVRADMVERLNGKVEHVDAESEPSASDGAEAWSALVAASRKGE